LFHGTPEFVLVFLYIKYKKTTSTGIAEQIRAVALPDKKIATP
jgi:hypothetical protein